MNSMENTMLLELEPEFDQALADHLNSICCNQIKLGNPVCLASLVELELVTAQGLSLHRRKIKEQLKKRRFSCS